jgi:hypothetical protein
MITPRVSVLQILPRGARPGDGMVRPGVKVSDQFVINIPVCPARTETLRVTAAGPGPGINLTTLDFASHGL